MFPLLNPIFLLGILIALSVHEWAHAFTAYKLGDSTAKDHGRMTLNPLAHLDLLGSILFLAAFGWGKPVPVNPRNFRHPKRDSAITALAGPVSNLVLAAVSFGGLFLLFPHTSSPSSSSLLDLLLTQPGGSPFTAFAHQFLSACLFLNLGLMAFNLLPIAPLDGSKVLQAFIPVSLEDAYDTFMQWGPYVLLSLLIGERLLNLSLLSGWISWWIDAVLHLFQVLVGGKF